MSKLIELVNGSFEQSHYDKTNIDNYPYVAFSNADKKLLYTHIPNFFYIESRVNSNNISLGSGTWIGQKSSQLEYSIDKVNWNPLNITSYTLNKGEKMYFRCVDGNIEKNSNDSKPLLKPSGKFNIGGDISTVIYGEENIQTIINSYAMCCLFYNTKVIDASKLLLPATTLAENCYNGMFLSCDYLTIAPELPATTLVPYCYRGMFSGCNSLTSAPELPAMTLAPYCYSGMFDSCTSITIAPELHVTELAEGCYQSMFWDCTSLITTPELPATTLAEGCYQSMFGYCESLTTAPELPATELAEGCYNGMFGYCTSLTTAPELPATTLAERCYGYMFQKCTSLTTAPELPATTLVNHCYSFMFSGCTNLNYIKCLATDIFAYNCTGYWVNEVSDSGTFIKHPDMSSWTTGRNDIPSGWEVMDADL